MTSFKNIKSRWDKLKGLTKDKLKAEVDNTAASEKADRENLILIILYQECTQTNYTVQWIMSIDDVQQGIEVWNS